MRRPFQPNYLVDPAQSLHEVLVELKLTPSRAARRLGVPLFDLQQVLAGSAPISDSLSEKLATLGPSAQFWRNLEANYQGDRARLSRG